MSDLCTRICVPTDTVQYLGFESFDLMSIAFKNTVNMMMYASNGSVVSGDHICHVI